MNWKLLTRYLSDQCSEDERRRVQNWLAEDPVNKELLLTLKNIWEVEPNSHRKFDAEKAWDRFKEKNINPGKTDSQLYPKAHATAHHHFSENNKKWALYFSAIAALFLLVFFFVYRLDSLNSNVRSGQTQLTMQEIVTEKGQKTSFTLNDGTRVFLNAESSLQIPATFVKGKRQVYLRGEAYFDVSHIENSSFIVQTDHFDTQVLGTKFVVSSYPDEIHPKVAVSEGKVSLNRKTDSEVLGYLTQNQLGTITSEGEAEIVNVSETDVYFGWTEGKLIFNETSLREIIPRLERWYDVEVKIEDPSILSRKLTATFEKEPFSEVLKIITISLELEYVYERNNRTITLFNYDSNTNQ